jgi:NADPH:quinone reductase-like Zn-dependent oxidoreductase
VITTEAWVLHAGRGVQDPAGAARAGELRLETYSFSDLADGEVLIAPLVGCWEANMTHAIRRHPIDICLTRGEGAVVLGNSGVVEVVRTGRSVSNVAVGQRCLLAPVGKLDPDSYLELVHAYDAPDTIGLLGQQVKVPARTLFPIPADSAHGIHRWASYGRFWTAWDNWRVAYACWRTQVTATVAGGGSGSVPLAFGWGGGVSLAGLQLAQAEGFRTAMAASRPSRLKLIADLGMIAIDRRQFPHLGGSAGLGRAEQQRSEREFLDLVGELSDGRGISILLDNIGGELYGIGLRALARQAVLATVGWKAGMRLETLRAVECIRRHIHVHTHGFRYSDIPEIIDFQERTGFLAAVDESGPLAYAFEAIGVLAKECVADQVDDYFPLFGVNEVVG